MTVSTRIRVLMNSGEFMAKRILLMDDNAQFRELLVLTFSQYDCVMETASSGTEGLERFFAQTPPDLVVLDLMLPEMDGYAVCDIIRKSNQGKDTPIIVMATVSKTESHRKRMQSEMKVQAFFEKPFAISEFLATVNSILGLHSLDTSVTQSSASDKAQLMGEFSEFMTLGKILYQVYQHRLSGTLVLKKEKEKIEKKIYCVKGAPIFVDSNNPEERLGSMLLKRGKITEQEIDHFWDIMVQQKIGLEQAIVKLGTMNSVDFLREHREQTLLKIAYSYNWNKGSYHFNKDMSFIDNVTVFDFKPLEVIRFCARRTHSPYDIEQKLKRYPNHYHLSLKSDLTDWKKLELSDHEQQFISLAEQGISVSSALKIIERCPSITYLIGIFMELELCSFIEMAPHTPEKFDIETFCEQGKKSTDQPLDNAADEFQTPNDFTSAIIQQALGEIEILQQKRARHASTVPANDQGKSPRDEVSTHAPEDTTEAEEAKKQKQSLRQLIAELMAKDNFDLFRLNKSTFTRQEIMQKYYSLADQFHPDKFLFEPDPTIRRTALALFNRIKTGYTDLCALCHDENADQEAASPVADSGTPPSPDTDQIDLILFDDDGDENPSK